MAGARRRSVPRAGGGGLLGLIAAKTPFFLYGSYPPDQRWRVDLAFFLAAGLIFWALWPGARGKGLAAFGFFVVLPPLGFALLQRRAGLGLPRVGTNLWGGAMVTLLVALTGIVVALPGGVLLALGRRSDLPAVRLLCAGLIEFARGAPLIAVLFMANAMLPLFLPPDWAPDRLLRPIVRRRAVRLGLYGGSGARRAQRRAAGARRGGAGFGAWPDRDFALRRPAAGFCRGDPGHRQQFRGSVQGHDLGGDRRHIRFSA